MSLIDKLLTRKSHNKLIAPAPTEEQVKQMIKLALRAPDHALLKPWRFQIYSGDSLIELGENFAKASQMADPEMTKEKLEKIKNKPLRAPMLIIASVVIESHPKVPEIEQYLSAGASVQNLLIGAHLINIGAMWRTGSLCFNRHLMELLGYESNEFIVGFIYLGHEDGEKRAPKHPELAKFVDWK